MISGVFSSIFIAVPLWGIMNMKKSPKHKLVVYKKRNRTMKRF
ncbi:hypothetical protein ACVQ9Z_08585 [Staphylococcus aureus]